MSAIEREYTVNRELHRRHKKEFDNVFLDLADMLGKCKGEIEEWREDLGLDEIEQDQKSKWIEDPFVVKVAKLEHSPI